jgi:hypothetical protein
MRWPISASVTKRLSTNCMRSARRLDSGKSRVDARVRKSVTPGNCKRAGWERETDLVHVGHDQVLRRSLRARGRSPRQWMFRGRVAEIQMLRQEVAHTEPPGSMGNIPPVPLHEALIRRREEHVREVGPRRDASAIAVRARRPVTLSKVPPLRVPRQAETGIVQREGRGADSARG